MTTKQTIQVFKDEQMCQLRAINRLKKRITKLEKRPAQIVEIHRKNNYLA